MKKTTTFLVSLFLPFLGMASEADLKIPELAVSFNLFGATVSGRALLGSGIVICLLGMAFGLFEFMKIKKLPVHRAMSEVSELIYCGEI